MYFFTYNFAPEVPLDVDCWWTESPQIKLIFYFELSKWYVIVSIFLLLH
jgi:hypothetical protein